MLVNLHVKNFAIIDEIDVDFSSGLNILTGETGAGKSILIGSIGIALGARVSQEIIGKHGDSAMVEIVFQIEDEETKGKLSGLGVDPDEGQIVISRRITGSRSVNRINGENVSVSVIRQVAALCIDIHGQHENQSLLQKDKHLAIVDEFATKQCVTLKQEIAALYREYTALKNSGRMKMCRMRSVRENLVFWNTKNRKLSRHLYKPVKSKKWKKHTAEHPALRQLWNRLAWYTV